MVSFLNRRDCLSSGWHLSHWRKDQDKRESTMKRLTYGGMVSQPGKYSLLVGKLSLKTVFWSVTYFPTFLIFLTIDSFKVLLHMASTDQLRSKVFWHQDTDWPALATAVITCQLLPNIFMFITMIWKLPTILHYCQT